MIVILFVAVVGVVVVALQQADRREGPDLPERVAVAAAGRLPRSRSDWGRAMVAEMSAVPGRWPRWRFAAGVLRVALFPPASRRTAVGATTGIGLAATVAATVVAVRLVPTLSVFVGVLGLLVSGCAVIIARRWSPAPIKPVQIVAAAIAVAGVVASIGVSIGVAVVHPTAADDPTHVYSVVFALILCGYLVAGFSGTVRRPGEIETQLGAFMGATVAVVGTVALLPNGSVISPVPPLMAAAVFITAISIAIVTRSRRAGTRAGLLAGILAAPAYFAVTLMSAASAAGAPLTTAYDIDAYSHSGYPDVASFQLGDTLGGLIISLAVTPIAMAAIAATGAALVPRRLRPS